MKMNIQFCIIYVVFLCVLTEAIKTTSTNKEKTKLEPQADAPLSTHKGDNYSVEEYSDSVEKGDNIYFSNENVNENVNVNGNQEKNQSGNLSPNEYQEPYKEITEMYRQPDDELPTIKPRKLAKIEQPPARDCYVAEKMYKDGEEFYSGNQLCMACKCQDGEIACNHDKCVEIFLPLTTTELPDINLSPVISQSEPYNVVDDLYLGKQGRQGEPGHPESPDMPEIPGASGLPGPPPDTSYYTKQLADDVLSSSDKGPSGPILSDNFQYLQAQYGGPPGPVGMIDTQGFQGVRGEPGETGPTGQPDQAGPRGFKGQTGLKGDLPGEKGERGVDGNVGPAGIFGFKGEPGNPGITGQAGPRGLPGTPGEDGKLGYSGQKGDRGWEGRNGAPGIPGLPGLKGDLGFPGEKGERGVDCNVGPAGIFGFKGEPGNPGITGHAGPRGLPGTPGEDGKLGYSGQKGDRGWDGKDGAPGIPGLPGLRGDYGLPGIFGRKGEPGYPGIKGQPGEHGPQGLIGLTGAKGENGEKGREGVLGRPGVPGRLGPRGDTGLQGKDGQTGIQGHDGYPGIRGLMGPTGPKGSPGNKGETGLGPPGPPGPPGKSIGFNAASLAELMRHGNEKGPCMQSDDPINIKDKITAEELREIVLKSCECMNGQFERFKNPDGQKTSPAKTCRDLAVSHPELSSGQYWIDPNEGDSRDAILVYCDMKRMASCVMAQPQKSDIINYVGDDKSQWLSELSDGMKMTYKAYSNQLGFLQILSGHATQNITYHCKNSVAYYNEETKSHRNSLRILSWNGVELSEKGPQQLRYDVVEDGCKIKNSMWSKSVLSYTTDKPSRLPFVDINLRDIGTADQEFWIEVSDACFYNE